MILKFFLFMFLLVILALIGVGFIFRRMKRLFSIKPENIKSNIKRKDDENVIYKKDDVVVLKGEANESKR